MGGVGRHAQVRMHLQIRTLSKQFYQQPSNDDKAVVQTLNYGVDSLLQAAFLNLTYDLTL